MRAEISIYGRGPQIGADAVTPLTTSAFDLPDHLAAKADPALIAGDEQHFAAIAESLEQSIADLSERLDAERRAPGGIGQEALDRDLEIHRLTARLRTLRRFGLDLCLGRIVARRRPRAACTSAGSASPTARAAGCCSTGAPPRPSRSSAPTHANPMGLASRRRYRWTRGRITDYWDEVFTADGFDGHAAARRPVRLHRQPGQQPVGPDARRARHHPGRPGRDHPRRIRAAPSSSTAARAPARPSSPCTAPPTCSTPTRASVTAAAACCSSARTSPTWPTSPTSCPASARRACRPAPCATSSPREPTAAVETDPDVARLKSSADMVTAIEAAVRFYEEPPTDGHDGRDRRWSDIRLSPDDWAEAFEAPDPGTPHNEARDQVWDELLTILVDKHDGDESPTTCSASRCSRTGSCSRTFNRAWPLLERDRPRRRPVVGAGLPAQVRALARRRRRPGAAARGRRRPGRCPTCRSWTPPGSGSATRRRPGAGAGTRPSSPPNASGWPTSSTS